jgi:hypothetical protein
MTQEEMMARGLVPEETKHNGHRRAHFHDYNRLGVYMLTLVIEGRQRLFGSIVGHTRGQRGTEDYPHLQCSTLGTTILQEEIAKIPYYYKEVEVMKVALMPDHIHLLVNVKRKLIRAITTASSSGTACWKTSADIWTRTLSEHDCGRSVRT